MKLGINNNEKVTMVEYTTMYGPIYVTVRYITEESVRRILKSSKVKTYSRQHQGIEDYDDSKYRKNMMEAGLVEITGMQIKHLRTIIEPHVEITLGEGETMDSKLEWSTEIKDYLKQYMNATFAIFLLGAMREEEAFILADEAREKQNLSIGSATSTAPAI
jgi:hypothetical protein